MGSQGQVSRVSLQTEEIAFVRGESRVADRIANAKSLVKRRVSRAGIARKLSKKDVAVVSFLVKGQPRKSPSASGALAWRSTFTPCPSDGTWRTATASCSAQLHRVHQPLASPPVCGLPISQPGTCNAGPAQPMGARRPLLRRATNPHSSKFRNFLSSASVIPFDHQHTSPLSDSPIRQAESVKMPVCPVPLETSNFTSARGAVDSSPSRPAREGCACGAMEGGAMGRHWQCVDFSGKKRLKQKIADEYFPRI